MRDWDERARRAQERYEDGASRLPEDRDERQRQLTRMGNAAWAAGLSLLMLGRRDEADVWLVRAAETYRESWPDAPPGSWGRPLGAMKSRLIAQDLSGAEEDARWALGAGAADAESPIGRYAAVLAQLVLGDDDHAAVLAPTLVAAESIAPGVSDSLVALAAHDAPAYESAILALVEDFESRTEYLEDVPVADTVLAFQELAGRRRIVLEISSRLLPRLG